ncbi:UPF0236 family transposase-like protein [Caldisalinibacter kiritimatiensis]|nr:UPF0236 family protein [Caldisalinibacter kiritimatiensis]
MIINCILWNAEPRNAEPGSSFHETEEGKKGYKFLLDEYLKMDTVGHISTNLVEKIIDLAVDEIQTKIVNGDGAGWIKEIVKEDNSYFQLDIFHRNQAVIKNVEDKSKAKKIIKKLSIGKIDEGLEIITELMIENNGMVVQ